MTEVLGLLMIVDRVVLVVDKYVEEEDFEELVDDGDDELVEDSAKELDDGLEELLEEPLEELLEELEEGLFELDAELARLLYMVNRDEPPHC